MKDIKGSIIIRLLIFMIDIVVLNAVLLFFLQNRVTSVPEIFTARTKFFFFVMNISLVVAEYFLPPIVSLRFAKISMVFKRVAGLVLFQTLISFFILRLFDFKGGLFNFMLVVGPTLFVCIFASRVIEFSAIRRYRAHGGNIREAIFVGNDPALEPLYHALAGDLSLGIRVLGFYGDDSIAGLEGKIKQLGTIKDFDELLDKIMNTSDRLCDSVYVSISYNDSDFIAKIMEACDRHAIHFFYVPRRFKNYGFNLKAESIMGVTVMTNYIDPLLNPTNRFLKRAFDVVFSSIVCFFVLLLTPIIGLIIKMQSRGPIFFKQSRTGFDGKEFSCLKFRSMHVNAKADTLQATKNDPRKFPFGNFMRKTNIDELPQFFNVLKGDMSIVGPRPHMLKHTEKYSKLIDKYMVRHLCKPGITGLAQVTGYRGETKELWQMRGRIEKDIWYLEHWSIGLDLKIIIKTVLSIVKPDKNAY